MGYFIVKMIHREVLVVSSIKSRAVLKWTIATEDLMTRVTEELQGSSHLQNALIATAGMLVSTVYVWTFLL